jgi:signal transduction histidine kinase
LDIAYQAIIKAEKHLKEYIRGLEEMMFITSHKVRQPVANILGLSSILHQVIDTPDELTKLVGYLQASAITLDAFTKELTEFITKLDREGKKNL